jgi:hypothetical protein
LYGWLLIYPVLKPELIPPLLNAGAEYVLVAGFCVDAGLDVNGLDILGDTLTGLLKLGLVVLVGVCVVCGLTVVFCPLKKRYHIRKPPPISNPAITNGCDLMPFMILPWIVFAIILHLLYS